MNTAKQMAQQAQHELDHIIKPTLIQHQTIRLLLKRTAQGVSLWQRIQLWNSNRWVHRRRRFLEAVCKQGV